ncbi:MAG: AmmeMemoRadiSam system radical SAM enzyme [Candidatus Kuenenbacteria bacterium]
MKKTLLYKKLKNKIVQCEICNHYCIILPKERGFCGTRENQNGILYSLVYNKVIAENIDPIEKKPFYHFMPGSHSLSIATVGCNFRCLHCQNWQISQATKFKKQTDILGENLSPKKIVERALKNKCQSIAYTYTEPTIFLEYALDIMKLAKKQGLKNIWISNGYMTKGAIELIAPYLDAINIDLKSFTEKFYNKYCGTKLKPILENLKLFKQKNIWLEITTLIIPTLNDDLKELKKMAEFIFQELGRNVPWHLSKFFPSYKLENIISTPIETLIKAREIGLNAGLKYVYLGNVSNHAGSDTYCPECKALIIERIGYQIKRFDKNNNCPKCKEKIDLIN